MAVATKAFFDMTYDKRTTEAILFGDACYNVSGPMAEISREWGMFQVTEATSAKSEPVVSVFIPLPKDFSPRGTIKLYSK